MDLVQDMIMIITCLQQNENYFRKEFFYSGIKTFSHLPKTIKELSLDVKQFRLVLNRFIISNSFYSLEEYFDINWK